MALTFHSNSLTGRPTWSLWEWRCKRLQLYQKWPHSRRHQKELQSRRQQKVRQLLCQSSPRLQNSTLLIKTALPRQLPVKPPPMAWRQLQWESPITSPGNSPSAAIKVTWLSRQSSSRKWWRASPPTSGWTVRWPRRPGGRKRQPRTTVSRPCPWVCSAVASSSSRSASSPWRTSTLCSWRSSISSNRGRRRRGFQ